MTRHWFEQRLRQFSRTRRHLLNAALGYRLGTAAAVIGAVGLVVLSGWLPATLPAAIATLVLAAVGAIVLVGLLAAYPLRRVPFRSVLDEAFHVERLVGQLNSRVISAWDFVSENVTGPLALYVVRQAQVDLQAPVEERLDRTERNRRRRQFATAAAVFLALGVTPWFGFARVAGNLERSWALTLDWLFPVQFALEPSGSRHIRRLGESLEFVLRFEQRKFDNVTVWIEEAADGAASPAEGAAEGAAASDASNVGGAATASTSASAGGAAKSTASTRELQLPVGDDGVARYSLTSPVEATYRVRFAFGSRRTDPVECVFTTAPTLVHMQTELVSPSYTGQLPRSLEGVQQRLLGLPGARMTLGFTFSKELESAVITWDDETSLPLETLGRFASVGLVHQQARQARLQVRDVHGLEMDDPLLIDFDLQVDEKPQVLVPKHLKEDMPLLASEVSAFGFGVRAQDDYGVTRCLLKWTRSTVDSPATILEQGEVERLVSPSQRNVVLNFEKVFDGLTLRTGDKVTFDVEATDNRAPDKQVARSKRFSFFVYEQDLGKLSIAQLGFGGAKDLIEQRIGKSQKASAVKSPEGLKNRELVKNEFDADVRTSTQAPAVRGEFGRATQDYFRVLSNARYEDPKKKPAPAPEPLP